MLIKSEKYAVGIVLTLVIGLLITTTLGNMPLSNYIGGLIIAVSIILAIITVIHITKENNGGKKQ